MDAAQHWCSLIEERAARQPAQFLLACQQALAALYAAAIDLRLALPVDDDPEQAADFLLATAESHLDRVRWAENQPVDAHREYHGMTHAEWVTLYKDLTATFRGANRHWQTEYPHAAEESPIEEGYLADEFADIYNEVRHGLWLWERGGQATGDATHFWIRSFAYHWGAHAVDALRGLHAVTTEPPDEALPGSGAA